MYILINSTILLQIVDHSTENASSDVTPHPAVDRDDVADLRSLSKVSFAVRISWVLMEPLGLLLVRFPQGEPHDHLKTREMAFEDGNNDARLPVKSLPLEVRVA